MGVDRLSPPLTDLDSSDDESDSELGSLRRKAGVGIPPRSAMQDVLRKDELRDNILASSSQGSLAACSRVSRAWSIPALRILWRELEYTGSASLFRQARLDENSKNVSLSGLVLSSDSPDNSSQFSLGDAVWKRFYKYASFVRRLSLKSGDEGDGAHSQFIQNALLEASSRGVLLFPSLDKLQLCPGRNDDSFKVAMLLIDDRTRELTLDWTSAADMSLVPFLARAENNSPNLTSLQIRTSSRTDSQEDEKLMAGAVHKLLRRLVFLRDISLPSRIQFHYDVWIATLELPRLRNIHATHEQSTELPQALESLMRRGAPPPGSAYHSLIDIACDIPYSGMHSILTGFRRTPRPEVRSVSFYFYDVPADGKINGFIADIMAGAPHLSCLTLVMAAHNTTLRLDHLMPHCRHSALSILKIQTNKQASLTNADLGQLAIGLPHLTEICITPDPSSVCPVRKASLAALSHFARYCRNIQTIALFLDTSGPYSPEASLPCFSETLLVLNFGSSRVQTDNIIPVALQLIHLTRGLQVTVCSCPVPGFISGRDPDSLRKDVQAWEHVSKGIRRLRPHIEAKESNAQRVLELEARVEALEAQAVQRDVKSGVGSCLHARRTSPLALTSQRIPRPPSEGGASHPVLGRYLR